MNVAITGACGLLGGHLGAALSRAHRVFGFDRHPWWGSRPIELFTGDLADERARRTFLDAAEPDLLLHCAAMVNVDECERRPADAYLVNGALPGKLAREVPSDCFVIYITTDGIFKGDRPLSTERDLPCPRTVYGRSKLQGEWEVQLATDNHLIVRTNFFGWSAGYKSSSAEWLYEALSSGSAITLFDDFWFTPIYVVDLVQAILQLIEARQCGIYHIVGSERVSKYDFGLMLASTAGLATTGLSRGSIEQAGLIAPRPKDMSLSAEKFARVAGYGTPGCRESIERFLADRQQALEARVARVRFDG